MAFAVEDFEDLVRLLEQHPEWRDRLRATLLGGEFQELPAAVRELVAAQQRTEARLAELAAAQQRTEARVDELAAAQQRTEAAQRLIEARLEELAAAQQRTEARLAELAAAQQRTDEALERLARTVDAAVAALTARMDEMTTEFGYMYEIFFRLRAPALFRRWLRRPRPVEVEDLALLDSATENGTVTQQEAEEIALTDLVLEGQDVQTREPAYLAVEVSRTINPDDVERARQRAAILRKAGLTARAAVGGRRITAEAQAAADSAGVLVALSLAQPA
jgi:DNA repair exonuclease SbcCD ATPase subunit